MDVKCSPVDDLSIKRKMTVGPLEGEIKRVFAPYITNLEVDKVEGITEELIKNEIDRITMRKNNVKASVGANGIASYKPSKRKMIGGVSKDVQQLNYVDQDAFKEALASVRKDSDETNWGKPSIHTPLNYSAYHFICLSYCLLHR